MHQEPSALSDVRLLAVALASERNGGLKAVEGQKDRYGPDYYS